MLLDELLPSRRAARLWMLRTTFSAPSAAQGSSKRSWRALSVNEDSNNPTSNQDESSDNSDCPPPFKRNRAVRSLAPSPCLRDTDRSSSPAVAPERISWVWSPTPETDSDLLRLLKGRFGLEQFREGQEEAVQAAIEGRDIILRLPTGAGKTVAVLLPPLYLRSGTTIIIVPLVSLLRQQARRVLLMGIPISAFYSGLTETVLEFGKFLLSQHIGTAKYPRPPFVIMTPEQMVKTEMRGILGRLYAKGLISRFIIDEAQCLFTWDSFRIAYPEMLRDLTHEYGRTPKTFVGATLTDAHIARLCDSLNVCRRGSVTRILRSLDRPNLYYEVRYGQKIRDIIAYARAALQGMTRTETGIIYCPTTKACEDIVKALNHVDIRAAAYYGVPDFKSEAKDPQPSMTAEEQTTTARLWRDGDIRVVVATSAFGMGIDKPDVRFVAHYGPPKSIDAWCQDSGRAGRDGQPAECIIFYATTNFHTHVNLNMRSMDEHVGESTAVYSQEGQEVPEEELQPLKAMHSACLNSFVGACLRRALLAPFSQGNVECGNCSACKLNTPVDSVDLLDWAKNALAALEVLQGQRELSCCKSDLNSLLRGAGTEKFKDCGLPLYGSGQLLKGLPMPLTQQKTGLILDILLIHGVFTLFRKRRKARQPRQPEHYYTWKAGPRAQAIKMGTDTIRCARALLL